MWLCLRSSWTLLSPHSLLPLLLTSADRTSSRILRFLGDNCGALVGVHVKPVRHARFPLQALTVWLNTRWTAAGAIACLASLRCNIGEIFWADLLFPLWQVMFAQHFHCIFGGFQGWWQAGEGQQTSLTANALDYVAKIPTSMYDTSTPEPGWQ